MPLPFGRSRTLGIAVGFRCSSFLWTLRDGQHNSFPYVQLKSPLLSVPTTEQWRDAFLAEWKRLSLSDRRRSLRDLAKLHPISVEQWIAWPGSGLKASLQAKQQTISQSGRGRLGEVLVVIDRFLDATDHSAAFFSKLSDLLLDATDVGDSDVIDIVRVALCGQKARQGKKLGSALYFDVARDEFPIDIASSKWADVLGEVLGDETVAVGICALTGNTCHLQVDNFPQPKVPRIGQMFLFAKNEEIRAAYRYGRFAEDAMHVSSDLMRRLAGTLELITAEHRKGQTWRTVPSEKAKQSDLLLAFVEQLADAPLADAMAGTEDEDQAIDGRAAFPNPHRKNNRRGKV